MLIKRGRYSFLIRPLLVISDLSILLILARIFFQPILGYSFFIFIGLAWLISAYITDFYEVYRFTKIVRLFSLLTKQAFYFSALLFAYFGVLRITEFALDTIVLFLTVLISIIGAVKIIIYYALKQYRYKLGGNNRRIVVVGSHASTKQLMQFFNKRKDLGYRVIKEFNKSKLDTLEELFVFMNAREVDEIYCSIEDLNDDEVNQVMKFCNKKRCGLKFIPNEKRIYSKRLHTDFYEYLPVLSIPEVSLNKSINRMVKRIFDIIFSILVIVLVLSWLIPVLYILVKMESSGPFLYKHRRNGINYKEFTCYKIRSLRYHSSEHEDQVQKNDKRVTKIGRFLRKTSIDELPQFFNVLLGDMSVVGPRPHMPRYTEEYAKRIDKYNFIFRHAVKPGLTGLAQIKGYRGEIINKEDIINRVKYDIFYIENWSLLLDLKIIFETFINLIRGQEKAY
ncbi:exopolysaccharide biosynthesis polyprenyl glycosylphosphotransferase [Aquimarina brevivitae]|uniref:Putative colanic acid biosynthesis UDP-glucose lipid carrier transferase n=1 Tax=Aquimarina brevivitae TaxID=323412 RepID=A0A4Q7PFZ5_9FLAO|nr:exopolysaccharide biosynthesis polyprenyl glycosylphosphotransferase [Aquimarina brevivitae]RZS99275.1 putative colanic acid biosynthesis UDP-glucose lipid carrier transferase [Aquimarina brevivitae]